MYLPFAADELDEMLSDASSPFNELEDNIPEMAIFDELLDETGMDMARGGQCASYQCGSTPLSHPPPLLRQQARSYGYDQAPMAVQNMSPAGLMHLGRFSWFVTGRNTPSKKIEKRRLVATWHFSVHACIFHFLLPNRVVVFAHRPYLAFLFFSAGNSLEPSAGGHMMVASSYPNSKQ